DDSPAQGELQQGNRPCPGNQHSHGRQAPLESLRENAGRKRRRAGEPAARDRGLKLARSASEGRIRTVQPSLARRASMKSATRTTRAEWSRNAAGNSGNGRAAQTAAPAATATSGPNLSRRRHNGNENSECFRSWLPS